MKRESFALAALIALIPALAAVPKHPANAADGEAVFATVDGVNIGVEEYEREVYAAARQTYYHGRPPSAEEYIEFRKGVADRLIDRYLLLGEAQRRDLEPDTEAIDARIAQYEARYGNTERWQAEGAAMIAAVRDRFEQESILDALEAQVRRVDPPDESTVRQFYDDNPGLFTQPARRRVAVILLGVAPSAGAPGWEAAREEAGMIMESLDEGGDFAELAALHSSDSSAAAGGDMGFMHEGTLSPDAEAAVSGLDVGGVSEPIRVLEGIAIFKLLDQEPEELRAFTDVRDRAEDLWMRQAGEAQWQELTTELRSGSEIHVNNEQVVRVQGFDD